MCHLTPVSDNACVNTVICVAVVCDEYCAMVCGYFYAIVRSFLHIPFSHDESFDLGA
jgi:hypothetical protein